MKTTIHIIQLALAILLLPPSLSGALEIREEVYEFRMEPIRNATVTTFVMNNSSQTDTTVPARSEALAIHFEKGSAALTSRAVTSLYTGMQSQEITTDTPLVVTGYSCALGSSRLNLMLSLQRAITVAHSLLNRGYTISVLQAKGEEDPVTTNPLHFSRNRRVEITRQP